MLLRQGKAHEQRDAEAKHLTEQRDAEPDKVVFFEFFFKYTKAHWGVERKYKLKIKIVIVYSEFQIIGTRLSLIATSMWTRSWMMEGGAWTPQTHDGRSSRENPIEQRSQGTLYCRLCNAFLPLFNAYTAQLTCHPLLDKAFTCGVRATWLPNQWLTIHCSSLFSPTSRCDKSRAVHVGNCGSCVTINELFDCL